MKRVEEMLAEDPRLTIAYMTDDSSVPGVVILTVARRGLAVYEMAIPPDKYDPFLLMDMVARHYGGEPKQ
jgi:hypothetical protein